MKKLALLLLLLAGNSFAVTAVSNLVLSTEVATASDLAAKVSTSSGTATNLTLSGTAVLGDKARGGGASTNLGANSFAFGLDARASGGFSSVAIGSSATALGSSSAAIGNAAQANASYSIALGYGIVADHEGSFVFGDFSGPETGSVTNNSFNVRANGGVYLTTGGNGITLDGVNIDKGFAEISPYVNSYAATINISETNGLQQTISAISGDATINWPAGATGTETTISLSVPAVSTNTVTLDSAGVTYKFVSPLTSGSALSTTNNTLLLFYSPYGTTNATVTATEVAQ